MDSDSLLDPYDRPPSWWRVHGPEVAAAVVFVATVVLTVLSFPPFRFPEAAYAMLLPGVLWAYTRPTWRLYATTMLAAQAVVWTILLSWLHHVTWLGWLLLGPFIGVWVGV